MNLLLPIGAAVLFAALVCVIVILANKNMQAGKLNVRLEGEKKLLEDRLELQEQSFKAIADEREKTFESQRKQMEESFKYLSEQNSAGLRRQSAESISELLKPIQDKFEIFDRTMRESQVKDGERSSAMMEAVRQMMERSKSVGDEARNLANALTGHSKLQGDFGEMLLTDLLRNSGLEEGVQYSVQSVMFDEAGHEIKSDAGRTMIPDVIIHYPDDSHVIVDSKVSLTAFVNYCNCEDTVQRKLYAKQHIESISRHIDELKAKDYNSYLEDGQRKIDYNIMFIPIENAFRLMLEEEPVLWQKAKDSKVLIVSQQTLMIVLNMILISWRQHDQQKNIAEVYKTAEELMSQLKSWMSAFVNVGEYLGKAQSAYDESKRKLSESNQSVIRKIDKLEHLKLSPKRSNAKIKAGARMVAGQESVIPNELAQGLDS
ncbi:MAG: DNA recombination protein RmuC [Bacteroidales bacterium]|nr:DNA recombination protein RmuC [Bacteroidales bacterium]